MNWEGNLIWECKIGRTEIGSLPSGSDLPMREAIAIAYKMITGKEPEFIFSGWNAQLTNGEMSVIERK